MTDRIPCLVPGCRRTTPASTGFEEWICGPHWRPVSAFEKRHRAKIKRHMKKRPSPLLARLLASSWVRCSAAAIDAAAGNINAAELEQFLTTM